MARNATAEQSNAFAAQIKKCRISNAEFRMTKALKAGQPNASSLLSLLSY
jgi:hypothetical protein